MEPIISKARENLQETKKEVLVQSATLVNSAFAIVAAFAWNEAVKGLIDQYVPKASALTSKFLYAVVLTLIVVIVSMRLTRLINQYKTPEEEGEKEKDKKSKSKK